MLNNDRSRSADGWQFPFEKLRVWQQARKLVKLVYDDTRQFPDTERYGLTSQLNRAATSVACNLAEGVSRASRKDQAHFSALAYGSLMEVACLLLVCQDNEFLHEERVVELRQHVRDLSVGICALRRAQLRGVEEVERAGRAVERAKSC